MWKKNTPFLYDLMLTHALEWPTLTIEWLPSKTVGEKFSKQRLLAGTHTSDSEQNYLLVIDCNLPNEDTEVDVRKYDDEAGTTTGGFGGNDQVKMEISQRICHDGEVNRARHMPQQPNLVATKNVNSTVCIFDLDKHPERPESNVMQPDLVLDGHTKEGYGLNWSPLCRGHLLSGSDDHKVHVLYASMWCPRHMQEHVALLLRGVRNAPHVTSRCAFGIPTWPPPGRRMIL